MVRQTALMESLSAKLHGFLKQVGKNLSLPSKKFLRDSLIGLLRAGRPIVSEMARRLPDQRTKFLSRRDCLEEHLTKDGNFEDVVKQSLPELWLPFIQDDTPTALTGGIHPRTLYAMRDAGVLERLSRGLYRLADLPPLSNQDLVTVALKAPGGVVCLISALAFHEITTQIPHVVHLAMQRGAESPRLTHPPIRIYWFKGKAFSEGIEIHKVDGFQVRIYNAEKSVVDCFKYRNKIGLDVAIEALRLCWQRKHPTVDKLMHFARICRVEKVMRPYLEAIL